MRRLSRERWTPLLAVLAVLTATVGIGALTSDASTPAVPPAATRVPVAAATAVCPDARTAVGSATRITAAVPPPGDTGEPAPGSRAAIVRGLGRTAVDAALSSQGVALSQDVRVAGPYVLRARGGLAPGAAAMQLTSVSTAGRRSIAATACTAPGVDFWFVGGAAAVGQRSELVLSNAEDAPADLDVELYGPEGRIEVASARGVTVAAGRQTVLKLDALAPRVPRLAVHVVVRAGRVAAAMRDTQASGLDFRGADWVPPAAAPERRVVVPGVPGGAGARVLHVVVPEGSDAVVKLRLLAAGGPFAPAGADVLPVSAGSVAAIDLAPYAKQEPVAVELESDVPVTASVLARLGPGTGSGPSELAWTSAVPPLQAPALLADAGFGVGRRGELALATRGKATSVQIEPVAPAGAVAPRPFTAQVPESGSVVVRLPPPATAGGTYAVRIVPSGGGAGVWAAGLTWEEPPGLRLGSIVPVRASVGDVVVPEVAADLDVGVRRG